MAYNSRNQNEKESVRALDELMTTFKNHLDLGLAAGGEKIHRALGRRERAMYLSELAKRHRKDIGAARKKTEEMAKAYAGIGMKEEQRQLADLIEETAWEGRPS